MSLIHWWPLNGDTTNNGTIGGSSSWAGTATYVNGKIGKCAECNSSHYLTLPITETTGNYSISFWIKIPTSMSSNSSWETVISYNCYQNTTADSTYISWAGYQNLKIYGDSDHQYWWLSPSSNFSYDTWFHITLVHTTDNTQTTKLYINGVYIDIQTSSTVLRMRNGNMRLGSGVSVGSVYFNDVRIYDHALSAKEVKEISKGLVLHYTFEDPYVEATTNVAPNPSDFSGWSSYGDGYTSISDCELGNKKIVIENKNAWCGMYCYFSLPEAGTYTLSVWCKPITRSNSSLEQTLYTSGGGISDTATYVDWSKTGQWQRISMTRTYSSTWLGIYLIAYGGPNDGKISCEYTMPQIELKDHATPYVNGTRSAGMVYDSSGYGYDGIIIGDCQMIESSNYGKYSLLNNSTNIGTSTPTGAAYIKGDLKTNFTPSALTICFWTKVIRYDYQDSGILSLSINSDSPTDYNSNGVHQYDSVFRFNGSSNTGYVNASNLIDVNNWHHYALVYNGSVLSSYRDGVSITDASYSLGNIQAFRYIYLGLNVAGGAWRQSKENWSDFKIYATALSASDILAEYNRKASMDKSGNLFSGYFKEHDTTPNLLEKANYAAVTAGGLDGYWQTIKEANYAPSSTAIGVHAYTQGNLSVTSTVNGYRIYSEPNRDGRAQEGSEWNTWGGLVLDPMHVSRCLVKGHHYRISWHVSGQSSRAMVDTYWSNNIGWGQSPDAAPTVHKCVSQPANFQGEMDCFYDFTIEDEIFKTTGSSVHSGFEANTSYLAYAGFKIGYTYDYTGTLGTEVYITNIQMHDLTSDKIYKIGNNGVIKSTEFVSGKRDAARLHSDGVMDVTDLKEN